MAVKSFQLYSPPGGDYAIPYSFRKVGSSGAYEVLVIGIKSVGCVVHCIGGWSDTNELNPFRKTRREAAEDLIDDWIARKVSEAVDKIKES